MTLTKTWKLLFTSLATIVLAGCASLTEPRAPCCYPGQATLARLQDLTLRTSDGRRLAFLDVYEGFAPDSSLIAQQFPARRFFVDDEVFDPDLEAQLRAYDSNRNGRLEVPEMAVLYVQEGAMGLGRPVESISLRETRVNALATAPADAAGLIGYLKSNAAQLTPEARMLFKEIAFIGYQQRLRSRTNRPETSGRN